MLVLKCAPASRADRSAQGEGEGAADGRGEVKRRAAKEEAHRVTSGELSSMVEAQRGDLDRLRSQADKYARSIAGLRAKLGALPPKSAVTEARVGGVRAEQQQQQQQQ